MSGWQRTTGAFMGLGILALIATSARAETAEFPLETVRVIASEDGAARILLDPGDLSGLDLELVVSAILHLPLPARTPTNDVEITVTALNTAWADRSATWSSPWNEPGGDLDRTYAHTVTLSKSRAATSIAIDVTPMVRDMADGVAAKNGFLLTVPPGRGDGFRTAEREVLGSLEGARLVVNYRRIKVFRMRHGSLSVLDRDEE